MVRVGDWSHERELGTGEVTAITTRSRYGVMDKTLDSQAKGRGFESRLRHLLCCATKEKNGSFGGFGAKILNDYNSRRNDDIATIFTILLMGS